MKHTVRVFRGTSTLLYEASFSVDRDTAIFLAGALLMTFVQGTSVDVLDEQLPYSTSRVFMMHQNTLDKVLGRP